MLRLSILISFFALSFSVSMALSEQAASVDGQEITPAPTQQPSSKTQQPNIAGEATAQDDEVISVETNLVNLLFTAVDRDKRFVTTLRQEDIRVREDGRPQEVSRFERQTDMPLSLALLIDRSVSQQRTLPEQKAAARAFLDTVVRSDKDEIAVLSFTGETTLEQFLTKDIERVRQAIGRVEFVPPPLPIDEKKRRQVNLNKPCYSYPSGVDLPLSATTAVWDALSLTAERVLAGRRARPATQTRRVIVLLSDGFDSSSQRVPREAAEQAIKSETIVYAIGIGDEACDGVNKDALSNMAERTGGLAFFPENEPELRSAFDKISQELRSQYLVSYSPTNKTRGRQFRQVHVEIVNRELRRQKLRLTYRPGYYANPP